MWKMILIEMVGMLAVLYIATGSISGFLYIPILVILLSVFVVVGGKHGLKGVGVSILVFIVSLVMFNAYYNFTCGPNSADVKVMKPMAEKISAYIVKNGIPESLQDIPDLPYGLEGCKSKINQDNSKTEICVTNRNIDVIFDYGEFTIDKINYKEAHLEMRNDVSETGLLAAFTNNDNSTFILDGQIKLYSGKTSGICNTLKQ